MSPMSSEDDAVATVVAVRSLSRAARSSEERRRRCGYGASSERTQTSGSEPSAAYSPRRQCLRLGHSVSTFNLAPIIASSAIQLNR